MTEPKNNGVPMSLVMGVLHTIGGVLLAISLSIASWTLVQVISLGNEQASIRTRQAAMEQQAASDKASIDRRFSEQRADQDRRFGEVLAAIRDLSKQIDGIKRPEPQ